MHYEGQMLSLVKTLYSANKEQEVFAILESDKDIRDNPYAKLTMSRDEREQLEVNKGKCIEVRHLTDILGFVRAACRCVGISYVYFSKLDLIIVVDELGGTMFGNRMMIETFLNELDVPYELNS